MSDDRQQVDYITIQEIYQVVMTNHYSGQIWVSLDGPSTGLWILQMKKEYKTYQSVFNNILCDSCTDKYGQSDWLAYVTRLAHPD
jgi:hypothetical protein